MFVKLIVLDFMNTSWVLPSPPTGNNRIIELAGTDLWITGLINNVFVYPLALDFDRLKTALGAALSSWPFIAGRFLKQNGRYVIEMSDNHIPVTFVEDNVQEKWPADLNVVVDKDSGILQPFLDEVESKNLVGGSRHEQLFRLKLTHLKNSEEWVMGASWSHILGDGDACLQFLNAISSLYQGKTPLNPNPMFERYLWPENNVDQHLLSNIEQFLVNAQIQTNKGVQVNICFSNEHLQKLNESISDPDLSIGNVLSAYIISKLNNLRAEDNEPFIKHANTMINYRKPSGSFASTNLVANAVLMPLSNPFENPQSVSSIARIIRQSINDSMEDNFIKRWVSTADHVMKRIVLEGHLPQMSILKDRIVLNSNLKFDWAGRVDFGQTNQCRFYTTWTRLLYIRIFRRNPECDGIEWKKGDGIEVAFRIEENKNERFLKAFDEDCRQNFDHV